VKALAELMAFSEVKIANFPENKVLS